MDLLNLFVKIGVKDEASEAVEGVSQNIIGKLGKAAATAAKALAGAFAVKKVYEFGKAAFDAYSEFEQLAGGVAKLYGNAGMSIEQYAESVGKSVDQVTDDYKRNAEAQQMVMDNAQQAWKTAGMDANMYMQTATSFSASLINSLGGDTKEAARLTDEAMKAMSDNVNTFGSDMGSVQNAFQGFAKQNYMMLDNLKLGYGGTKTEMERLIKDASQMTQEQEDLNMKVDAGSMSFDNIVRAIQVVQKHQGIYGTTAKEAMNTIEGSMNATKAAWSNLVAEFGKPDADIGARIGDMFTALLGENGEGGLVRNVVNEVRTIATNVVTGVGNAIGQGFDLLVQNGPQMVTDAMNAIGAALDSAIANLSSFGEGFDPLGALFGDGESDGIVQKVGDLITKIGAALEQNWPQISEKLGQLWDTFAEIVEQHGPEILAKVGEILGNIGRTIVERFPELVGAVAEGLMSLVEYVTSNGPMLVDKAVEIITTLVTTARDWISENGPMIVESVVQTVANIASAIASHAPQILANIGETIGKVIGYVIKQTPRIISAAIDFFGGLITGSSKEGEALHKWFADFFPDGLLKGLGDFATFLLDAGVALINGLLDGIGEVVPNVEQAIRDAFDSVLAFFEGVGEFIEDPVGSIKKGLEGVMGSLDDTGESSEKNMGRVEDSMGKGRGAVQKYNATPLKDKSAKATVTGNASNGQGKRHVDDTRAAINNLSGKSVDVKATGNATDGTAKRNIDSLVGSIRDLKDKKVTITTNHRNTTEGPTKMGSAWGGIRYHAEGGIRVASRYGTGVPIDVVGERGPEAIVPLTSHYGKDFARMMGKAAAGYMGGGDVYHVYLNVENSDYDQMAIAFTDALQTRSMLAGRTSTVDVGRR